MLDARSRVRSNAASLAADIAPAQPRGCAFKGMLHLIEVTAARIHTLPYPFRSVASDRQAGSCEKGAGAGLEAFSPLKNLYT